MQIPSVDDNTKERLVSEYTNAVSAVQAAIEALKPPRLSDYIPQGDRAWLNACIEYQDRIRPLRTILQDMEDLLDAVQRSDK